MTKTRDLADLGGGFIQAGTGAVQRTVESKLQDVVSVKDFGAVGDGIIDDTASFIKARDYIAGLGGGIIKVPAGTYKLVDLVVNTRSIVFEGAVVGTGYESLNVSTKLIPGDGAKFVIRFKGTSDTYAAGASAHSGLQNILLKGSAGTCEYGVFIDSSSTVLRNVHIEGFQYGCVIADQANCNVFEDCSFVLNTKVGFAVTEHLSASYLHPGITGTFNISSTTFSMSGCLFRQNNFGMVLRTAVGASFSNCVFESNTQAGLYIYRPDNASLRQLSFRNCWWENNYDAYANPSSYSLTGNRMFLLGNSSTYITWNSATYSGFQVVIDSQTHYGGGADTIDFDTCQFAGNDPQKLIYILSGFKYRFYKPWITGGNVSNRVKVASNAEAVHWHDPVVDNNPYGLVTSLTDNFGLNSGNCGAYYRSGTSFGTNELGGQYPIIGVQGGPIHFPELNASDPRRANARVLDDYREADFTPIFRVGASTPFTVTSQTNKVTKIGRLVRAEMDAALVVTSITAGQEKLTIMDLPYPVGGAGALVGQAWIQATGGGATVLANGLTPMYVLNTNTLYAAVDTFPVLSIGNTYQVKIEVLYTSAT